MGCVPPPGYHYRAYQDRVAADPDGHGMDYVHASMVISRVEGRGDGC